MRPKSVHDASPMRPQCILNFFIFNILQERHSYRAPSATSRYMQAAEAYAAKSRASRSNSSTGTGTWSAATTGNGKNTWSGGSASHRSRSRPQLTSDTFRPPSRSGNFSRPASRTTSASPGPWRRRNQSGGSQNGFEEDLMPPSSTHSTPCKKPLKNAANKGEFWRILSFRIERRDLDKRQ